MENNIDTCAWFIVNRLFILAIVPGHVQGIHGFDTMSRINFVYHVSLIQE